MRREEVTLDGSGLVVYGHYGRPVLVFPSQEGGRWDYEVHGMVDAVRPLIEAGRVKLYCVDSWDAGTWFAHDVDLEERARRHERYEGWLLQHVVPFIDADCSGHAEILATGCSFGAYHAANLVLRRADRFPLGICMSGVYDIARIGWGHRGDAFHFNNPMDSVAGLGGGHLDWLRRQASLLLVCGQGQWEDTTGALESTRTFAALLAAKGLRHELDLWGYDVPHDWPSWRSQLAHHLPRFC